MLDLRRVPPDPSRFRQATRSLAPPRKPRSDPLSDPDFRLWHRLEQVPLLAILATFAAALDLAMTRVFLRLAEHSVSDETLRYAAVFAPLPRNLFAVAGMVALLHGISPLMTAKGPGGAARSVGLAGFAGFFLLMVLLATVFPQAHVERVSVSVSLFASLLASQMLVWVLSTNAILRPAPRGIRTALGVLVLVSMLGIFLLVLELVPALLRAGALVSFAGAALVVEETLFLAVAVLVGVTLVRGIVRDRAWLSLLPGLIACVAVAVFFVVGMNQAGEFKKVLYGAFGWRALLDQTPALYAVPVGVFASVAAIGVVRTDGAEKQAGAGVALLACAGLAASSPARLLMWVLGAALISRAAIVFGERIVEGRTSSL